MKIITFFLMSLISLTFAAGEGGGTSGGGDLSGFTAYKVSERVFKTIQSLGSTLYSTAQLRTINEIHTEVKVVMTDEELPAIIDNKIQNGIAFSERLDRNSTIHIKRDRWEALDSILKKEVLIHHEIMVLAGIEGTGNYFLTDKFESLRGQYWKAMEDTGSLCTINLFEINTATGNPGKSVGSSSTIMNSYGAKGDMGILKKINKKTALIWRGVIDTFGYFKMEIDEVSYKSNKEELSLPDLDLGSITVKEKLNSYINPYNLEEPSGSPLVKGENFYIAVSCHPLQ